MVQIDKISFPDFGHAKNVQESPLEDSPLEDSPLEACKRLFPDPGHARYMPESTLQACKQS